MMKSRKNWIDWTKTFGIWFVIVGHGHLVNSQIQQFIYSFHMPLFFILSGYLLKPLPWKERLKKDVRSLLVPYLLINGCCFLLWFVGGYLIKTKYHWEIAPIIQRIGAIILGLGYNTDCWIPVSTPTWFLIALFFVRLIINYVKNITFIYFCRENMDNCKFTNFLKTVRYKTSGYFNVKGSFSQNIWTFPIIFISILTGFLFSYYNLRFYFAFNSVIMALPFFIVGIWLKNINLRKSVIVFLLCLATTLILNHYNGRVDMALFDYGKNMILYYLCGCSGSIMLITGCYFLKDCTYKFNQVISEGTILIIGFNLLAISLFKNLWVMIFSIKIDSFIGILLAVIILFTFYPFIYLILHHFPILLGKK